MLTMGVIMAMTTIMITEEATEVEVRKARERGDRGVPMPMRKCQNLEEVEVVSRRGRTGV